LGYDTIYGAQDIVDDEIIGMKSTSIKFKKNIKLFVSICYFISTILIGSLFYNQIGLNNFTVLVIIFILSLVYQVVRFKKKDPKKCLQAFKLNNFSGSVLFFGIFLIS
jgi:4-hydroxybenzoate polyprenyltransferase